MRPMAIIGVLLMVLAALVGYQYSEAAYYLTGNGNPTPNGEGGYLVCFLFICALLCMIGDSISRQIGKKI
jgi:hypothetical protein